MVGRDSKMKPQGGGRDQAEQRVKAQGPSRTCNESKEEDEEEGAQRVLEKQGNSQALVAGEDGRNRPDSGLQAPSPYPPH